MSRHTGHLNITHDTFKLLAKTSIEYSLQREQEMLQRWLHYHPECAHWEKYLELLHPHPQGVKRGASQEKIEGEPDPKKKKWE